MCCEFCEIWSWWRHCQCASAGTLRVGISSLAFFACTVPRGDLISAESGHITTSQATLVMYSNAEWLSGANHDIISFIVKQSSPLTASTTLWNWYALTTLANDNLLHSVDDNTITWTRDLAMKANMKWTECRLVQVRKQCNCALSNVHDTTSPPRTGHHIGPHLATTRNSCFHS